MVRWGDDSGARDASACGYVNIPCVWLALLSRSEARCAEIARTAFRGIASTHPAQSEHPWTPA
jgi:hypothetical protein